MTCIACLLEWMVCNFSIFLTKSKTKQNQTKIDMQDFYFWNGIKFLAGNSGFFCAWIVRNKVRITRKKVRIVRTVTSLSPKLKKIKIEIATLYFIIQNFCSCNYKFISCNLDFFLTIVSLYCAILKKCLNCEI